MSKAIASAFPAHLQSPKQEDVPHLGARAWDSPAGQTHLAVEYTVASTHKNCFTKG